jgi:hypothetical protein
VKCDYYKHHEDALGTCPRNAEYHVRDDTEFNLCEYHLVEWLFDPARAAKVEKWFNIEDIVDQHLRCLPSRSGRQCTRKYLAATFDFDEPAPASYRDTATGLPLCRYHMFMNMLTRLRTDKALEYVFAFKELAEGL